jgi:antitoxin (DNA-binding transcriptional repressor) of toxin-antitoxin stability system
MRTVTAMDMRKRLGEILDAASAGEMILIERDHKPLAFLVSFEEGQRMTQRDEALVEERLAALDQLVALGKEWRRTHPQQPGEMTAAEWIRWDRDHRDDEKYERIRRDRGTAEPAVGGDGDGRGDEP